MPTEIDNFAHRLIDLATAADGALGPGRVVDAYFGDYSPRAPEGKLNVATISDRLIDLADTISTYSDTAETARLRDMGATARSLGTFLGLLVDGNAMPYREAVEAVLGTGLVVPSEDDLTGLQRELSDCLGRVGATGDWPTNLRAWRDQNGVQAEDYLAILERKAADYRARVSRDVLCHVLGSGVSAELLSDSRIMYKLADTTEAWSAYHFYKGNSLSLVELNSNRIFNRMDAAAFASHEVYPGHHTQALIREFLYRRGELGVEGTLTILNTPSNVLAEGLGDYARFLIEEDLEQSEQVAFLSDQLSTQWRHRLGVAVHEGEMSEIDACNELSERAGLDVESATRAMRFAVEWKYYFPSYVIGLNCVRNLISKHGKMILRELYTRDSLAGLH